MILDKVLPMLSVIAAFIIIVAAAKQLGAFFEKIKLPLITGFIVVGVLAGPFVLKMTPTNLEDLNFVNEIALGFIALAAGAEMFLKEIRDRSRQIIIMTTSQIVLTFFISFLMMYLFIDLIPFAKTFSQKTTIAFIILASTIFIAPSLATSIPLVNELRAKGPFTKTALGVTVIKDIFLIVIFAITFSVADILVSETKLNLVEILTVLLDLVLSIGVGLLYAYIYKVVFKLKKPYFLEVILFLLAGWTTFLLSHFVSDFSLKYLHLHIHLEAILIGITASFYIVNYTSFKANVQKLVEDVGPFVYVAFFTLVGASLSIDSLVKYWAIALGFFVLRLILTFVSSAVGSIISKDSWKETLLSWTPHVAQAGISLGLISLVAAHFESFGKDFEAVLVAMIVINQFIGPPLMKMAIVKLGESHTKSKNYEFDKVRDVFIIGLEGKAIVLARMLTKKGDRVQIITDRKLPNNDIDDVIIHEVDEIDYHSLKKLNFKRADSVIILREENEAYRIAEIIYEKFGTPNVVVRVDKPNTTKDFERIGATVVEPVSAVISLLEHFVRSPQATSILLGLKESQESEDIEVLAKDVHGMALRDLQLPLGILILSITRSGQIMLPHGYTRLRIGDIVTIVGAKEQIDIVRTKLQY